MLTILISHCQYPKFTNTNAVVNHKKIKDSACGWSQDGLKTFNELAQEIAKDRKEHGEEFDEEFKTSVQMQMESKTTSSIGKPKNDIQTYNDLNGEALILKKDEDSDEEDWVKKNSFQV